MFVLFYFFQLKIRIMSSIEWMDPTQGSKGGPMNVKVPAIEDLLQRDPMLRPHEREIRRRQDKSF
jgi:hypothetical protein